MSDKRFQHFVKRSHDSISRALHHVKRVAKLIESACILHCSIDRTLYSVDSACIRLEEPCVRKICYILSGRLFPDGLSMRISQLVRMKDISYKYHVKEVQQEMKTRREGARTHLIRQQKLANTHEQSRSHTHTCPPGRCSPRRPRHGAQRRCVDIFCRWDSATYANPCQS